MNCRHAVLALVPVLAIISGCGTTETCSDERLYQRAVAGKHIEPPEGLDPLPGEREMTIPQASPQAPKPPGECIDAPPTLRTGSSDN